ncbi:MAG TPA: MotA/TolQ/ExbB proton channel family protein [Firmicutes bacterium]|nr:MotA/TolQ/ExbB proton channel family protein [Bacillota bacterium]
MVDVLIKGGPVMIPLLICSVLSLAITFERIYYLWRTRSDPERALQAVTLALEHGKIGDAIAAVEKFRGQIGSLMSAALLSYGKGREEIEAAMKAAGEKEVYKMERRVSVLDMLVTISPLLGLLGTVTGIIKSFKILATSPQILEPSQLSSGIAEALITTAAGLIIAVPTLAFHTYIVSIIDRRILEMDEFSTDLLDILSSEVKRDDVPSQLQKEASN